VLPFGRLWYGEPNAVSNEIGYAKHRSRSHDAKVGPRALVQLPVFGVGLSQASAKDGLIRQKNLLIITAERPKRLALPNIVRERKSHGHHSSDHSDFAFDRRAAGMAV
jgi:hypothetical protein